mmetsp:Transcript_13741/g.32534  ORF Transcript_13741/g.32534 Transcript_13741/m.32534 type:complete len:209 (+) Transcript_13741:105-731(+)
MEFLIPERSSVELEVLRTRPWASSGRRAEIASTTRFMRRRRGRATNGGPCMTRGQGDKVLLTRLNGCFELCNLRSVCLFRLVELVLEHLELVASRIALHCERADGGAAFVGRDRHSLELKCVDLELTSQVGDDAFRGTLVSEGAFGLTARGIEPLSRAFRLSNGGVPGLPHSPQLSIVKLRGSSLHLRHFLAQRYFQHLHLVVSCVVL